MSLARPGRLACAFTQEADVFKLSAFALTDKQAIHLKLAVLMSSPRSRGSCRFERLTLDSRQGGKDCSSQRVQKLASKESRRTNQDHLERFGFTLMHRDAVPLRDAACRFANTGLVEPDISAMPRRTFPFPSNRLAGLGLTDWERKRRIMG